MKNIKSAFAAAALLIILTGESVNCFAQDPVSIKLPDPRTGGGKPLMQALKQRQSSREFDTRRIPDQVLSDMLWAACGINRPESGLRTNPTAKNMQQIEVYVVLPEATYLYDAGSNTLAPIAKGDLRAATGGQDFVKNAPVNLVFVADYGRMGGMPDRTKDFYAATDTGNVSQNVYLFCASEGLATVVRGWLDKEELAKKMKLGPTRKVILAQTVGYPKE